jgi:hypothetical protein
MYDSEFHKFYSSQNVTKETKSRQIRLMGFADEKCIVTKCSSEETERNGRAHLGDMVAGGRVILKRILEE